MRILNTSALTTFLLGSILYGGCGHSSSSDNNKTSGSFGSSEYVVVENEGLSLTDGFVEGSGKIAFKDPIGEIGSKKHYSMTFHLEDNGSVSLITHGDNDLENGVEIVLSRDGRVVKMKIVHDDKSTDQWTLEGLDASKELTIGVDVHNDETPAHILVWTESDYAEDAALFNSEEDGDAPGNGKATFWGVEVKNANLTRATIGDAKFSEHD